MRYWWQKCHAPPDTVPPIHTPRSVVSHWAYAAIAQAPYLLEDGLLEFHALHRGFNHHLRILESCIDGDTPKCVRHPQAYMRNRIALHTEAISREPCVPSLLVDPVTSPRRRLASSGVILRRDTSSRNVSPILSIPYQHKYTDTQPEVSEISDPSSHCRR